MAIKVIESGLPITTSHDALQGHLRKALRAAHGITPDKQYTSDDPGWPTVFPNHVVYPIQNQSYKRSYTAVQGAEGTDPTITLGNPKKVHMAYADSKEGDRSCLVEGLELDDPDASVTVTEGIQIDDIRIKESDKPIIIPIKVIAPGWGSSAYYSKKVLQEAAVNKVFKKGTHMMWNHPSATEEADRPEGDLTNLAAVLLEDAKWDDNGVKGPGLYSKAKVFSDFATQVSEKGAYIGVSINAGVKCHEGEAEGKSGRIADKFVYAYSTDFVTRAGAGGAPIVPARESDGGRKPLTKESSMTEAEITALNVRLAVLEAGNKAAVDENAALKAKLAAKEADTLRSSAVDAVESALKTADITVNRKVLERACALPVVKEGKLDPDWVKETVGLFTEGHGTKVTGAGGGAGTDSNSYTEADQKKDQDEMGRLLESMGVPKAGIATAVRGV